MAGYLDTEIRDGALYCDITIEKLGLPTRTMLCGIPIPYTGWNKIGDMFKEIAQSTCPVDTGYLRNHIDFSADEGGVECWSDAPYSAYQEYGTSRCKAQPYFEAALQVAVESQMDNFEATKNQFMEIDSDMAFLLRGCTGGLAESRLYLQKLEQMIAFMEAANADMAAEAGIYYDLTILYEAHAEVEARILELEEMQLEQQMAAQGGLLGFLVELIAQILAAIILSILVFPFQDIWSGQESHHSPSH